MNNKIFALTLTAIIFLIAMPFVSGELTNSTGNVAGQIWYNSNPSATSMTIKDTQSVSFSVYAFSVVSGLSVNVDLIDSTNGSVIRQIASINRDESFVNQYGINEFSNSYTLGKTEYGASGNYSIKLTATGDASSTTTILLPLVVASNTVPAITSTAITSVDEGQLYSYQVVAADSDVANFGDVLTYSLSVNPAASWLSIDSTGLVFGTAPLITSNQSLSVTVNVSDGMDSTVQNYNLLVVDSSAGDVNAPTVTITSPVNGTLYNSIQTILNYNADDAEGNLYQCWYSLDDGLTNSTATTCSGSFSGLSSTQGSNTWIIYASDTAGNLGTDSVTFTVDSISPVVAITSPLTGAVVNGDEAVVFTDSELTNAQCSLDNATWTNCTSGVTPISAIAGFSAITNGNTFTLYLRDTDAAGNVGTSSISLLKNTAIDTAAPIVTIIFPVTTDYDSDEDVDEIIYTATDSNIQSCWYSLNNGVTNSTAAICTGVFAGLDSRNGFNTWTVYARDSFGNIGSKSVTFFVDSNPERDRIVYQDPDEQKYLQQTSGGTPNVVSPVVDLTANIPGNFFARFINAIINFLKALFGFN